MDKVDAARYWLGGVFPDVATMVAVMRGRGAKFPDVGEVVAALAGGETHFDGVNGRRFRVFRDVVSSAQSTPV